MARSIVERWHPIPGLAERPAAIFDLSWQGAAQRLITTVLFATDAGEDDASAVVIFENVFAFQVFDENMELSALTDEDATVLGLSYPYGGSWPYLEVHDSEWIRQLAEHHGAWSPGDFRHFIITSRNMHLHVACRALAQPIYHLAV